MSPPDLQDVNSTDDIKLKAIAAVSAKETNFPPFEGLILRFTIVLTSNQQLLETDDRKSFVKKLHRFSLIDIADDPFQFAVGIRIVIDYLDSLIFVFRKIIFKRLADHAP